MKILLTVLAAIATFTVADENALQQLLADGSNQFTAKLFSEVVKEKPAQSVVLSAFSVLPPLAQLSLASVGESHDELLGVIGLKDDNTTKAVFSLVNNKLRSIKGITLNLANRVYIPETAELNQDFAKISNDVFQSEVKKVDFKKNVETAQEINAWVEDQTNHRIKDLVSPDSLDATTSALLVNALYFKGKWREPFNPALTLDQDFHVNKETTIKVPTMQKTKGTHKYGESPELNAKLLEMFYEGDEASFLIVLPNEVDGLAALEEKLKDPSALSKAIESMNERTVDVFLPKFKIETTTNLKSVLQKIGVNKLFSSDARLENLLKDSAKLYVSDAIQKAFIEVNEEGAEAAAANAIYIPMMKPMVPPPPRPIFKADRPFYYEIRTNFNSTSNPHITLFNGLLTKP